MVATLCLTLLLLLLLQGLQVLQYLVLDDCSSKVG
jgi:hypothetical protein